MYLTRLMYFSECNRQAHLKIEHILEAARERNSREDISGALWFDGDIFIQILEGQRKAVSRVYHLISSDPRHKNIELVECTSISKRLFSDWSMGYLAFSKVNRAKIFQFSGHTTLKPREMSPDSMLKFLLSLEEGGV